MENSGPKSSSSSSRSESMSVSPDPLRFLVQCNSVESSRNFFMAEEDEDAGGGLGRDTGLGGGSNFVTTRDLSSASDSRSGGAVEVAESWFARFWLSKSCSS